MRSRVLFLCLFAAFSLGITAWAGPDKPPPSWNGKPVDKMTAQEVKAANKELDGKIKKGDSSAVQQKTDLNNAFDKTPEGKRAKKEDELQKKKDELAIAEKQVDAFTEREIRAAGDREVLEKYGNYWDSDHHWPAPPDGNIGPGGDRDKRSEKLRKEGEKARKAKEEAIKRRKALQDEIQKLQDELYVKSGDTKAMGKEPSEKSPGDQGPAPGSPPKEFRPGLPLLESVQTGPSAGEEEPNPDAFGGQEFRAETAMPSPEIYREPAQREPSQSSSSSESGHTQEITGPACPPEQK